MKKPKKRNVFIHFKNLAGIFQYSDVKNYFIIST